MKTEPRFIADGMLGRLAQWLRIMGADCRYLADAPDDDLRRIAEVEDRLLLTRDAELAARAKGRSFFVHYQWYPDQLREVLRAFPAVDRPDRVFTRCVACNGALEEISKEAAAPAVPPGALERNDRYWRCADCGRTFWRGSHHDNTVALLERIRTGPMEGRTSF